MYPRLFEEGYIGSMNIRNKTVMPPMGTNLASEIGGVTPSMIHYYRERAKGGVGLIITEINSIDTPRGYALPKQLSIHDNSYIAGHNELVEAVKEHGAKIITQLHHAGRQTTPENTLGIQPVAPSAIPDPYLDVIPEELSITEIEDIIEKFINGAIRAQNAGYDGVEIHGAHGYLIGQFMSAFSNKRNDLYGGELENRMRFPLEIINGIKQHVGWDFPVIFRFSADEFVKDGINPEESIQIAHMLQEAGVDALDVSSGTYASMPTIIEPMNYPEGWRAYLAEKIKKEVNIPVITVGVIRSPETAEGILAEEKADFVALGRTLIADPEWPFKAMEERTEDIRKCITCNVWCIGERVFQNLHIRCTVNPVAGRELEYPYIKPTGNPQHFAIVGGGAAGMEAARVLATSGHRVSLFEKEPVLGGQVKLAAATPGKEKIQWATDYLETQIHKLGVEVHLNTEFHADMIQGTDISYVILGTGAAPLIPDIPGIHQPNVTTAWEILADRYQVGEKVVIIGGGNTGCETALLLKNKGVDVTIIEMQEELSLDSEPISRATLLNELEASGIGMLTSMNVREIKPDGIIALDRNWKEYWIPCTHTVLAMGAVPVNDLEWDLKSRGIHVILIGDAQKPRRLNNAIKDGFQAAQRIIKQETMTLPYHTFPNEELFRKTRQEHVIQ